MEFYTLQKEDNKYVPCNRFLCIFCHTSSVDDGWGCKICGCRMLRFSVGVYIFSVIMMINTVNDLADIISMDYFKNDKDNSFAIFFYIKLVSDVFIILGILFAVFSACLQKYTPSVIAYYLVAISFLLNTAFCIFILFQIGNASMIGFIKLLWKGVLFSIILWLFFDFVLMIFTWMLFCNMVDIKRKKQKQEQEDMFNFKF